MDAICLGLNHYFNTKSVYLSFAFQSNEEGIRKCLQVLAALSMKDSAKLVGYRVTNIQHNLQAVSLLILI